MRPTSVFKTRPCFSHHRRVTWAGWLASQRLSSRATYGPKVSKQFAVSTIQAWHGDNGHAALVVDVGAVTNLWTEILWGLTDCTVVWMIALDKLWLDLIGCSNQIHNGKVFDTYIEPYFSWCSKCIYTSKHTSTRQVGWMIMIVNSCTIFQAGDSLQDWYEMVLCTTNRPKCLPRSSFWWSPCHTHGQMYRLFPMILWERLFCSLHATVAPLRGTLKYSVFPWFGGNARNLVDYVVHCSLCSIHPLGSFGKQYWFGGAQTFLVD